LLLYHRQLVELSPGELKLQLASENLLVFKLDLRAFFVPGKIALIALLFATSQNEVSLVERFYNELLDEGGQADI
jgi:hypothetical protein